MKTMKYIYIYIYIDIYIDVYLFLHYKYMFLPLMVLPKLIISESEVKSWTVAYQAPSSMEFSRQEYWSGLPFKWTLFNWLKGK